ncbi:uncharacterized protein LOC142348554 [Convolutriloba macropyga]|uniref:uncharacterized protein LOC142348554 n=1 Tax=Convolutriloba macropyga TaxID=536237 RepID=UPI003F520563
MDAVREWVVSKGVLRSGDEAGYWTEFKRTKPAPLENGTLSSENEAIRKDRSLFSYYSTQMSEDFWRNDDQPGDKLDVRDEMCTAQSYPTDPAYAGLDDYPCSGYQLHYPLCLYYPPRPPATS